ncbi:hypothetical protein [Granulicella sp. L60]|uniref:hypothetical protein n=1 Tax=Granulicella sp. L60 TaxID=1641866 RepID=UPI0020B170AD|nr:hypothetical protein [Granulicella sp. L60]
MATSTGSLHTLGTVEPLPQASPSTRAAASTRAASVPWYIWCGVVAVTSAAIGGAWDVSWHRSIGRDSFWTPAHMAIYACGLIAAVVCGYLILATTFGRSAALKDASVNVLGFRAPIGAFIAAWGGIAMMTSAPFDNWWHAAYGLDVKIISPPHTLLILGMRGVSVGVLFLILAAMNRAEPMAGEESNATFRTLQRMFLYVGGLVVSGQMFFLLEKTWDVYLHGAGAYMAMGIAIPLVFAMLSRASRHRWAATYTSSVYMLFAIAEILILPLFPAQPKLGPVYYPVTHFVPASFPILLIVPAVALDLLWQRTRAWKFWQIALVSGAVFMAVLLLVEWNFATFLMSNAAQNRFFGTIYFDYNTRPGSYDLLRLFVRPEHGMVLATGLAWAAVYSVAGTWVGLRFGNWMKSVRR